MTITKPPLTSHHTAAGRPEPTTLNCFSLGPVHTAQCLDSLAQFTCYAFFIVCYPDTYSLPRPMLNIILYLNYLCSANIFNPSQMVPRHAHPSVSREWWSMLCLLGRGELRQMLLSSRDHWSLLGGIRVLGELRWLFRLEGACQRVEGRAEGRT